MSRMSTIHKLLQKSFFCRNQRPVAFLVSLLLALALFSQLVPGNITNAWAYTVVSPAEVKTMVENGTAGTIIDVRELGEYCTSGHIPCALNYPWNSGYLHAHYTELDMDSRFIIVCQSGNRSAQAAAFLGNQGFTNSYTMSGGMSAWLGEKQTCDVECPALYFPHIDVKMPWQTEIAIINTSAQAVSGSLQAWSDEGQLVMLKTVTLPAHGRKQIAVAEEFTNHTNIGYMVFNADSEEIQGYTKFYQAGLYRAAVPAVKEVNASNLYISHIDSSAQWWTGISLVNTTSETKELTITFNNGVSVPYSLNANAHKAFTIGELLNQQIQPDIKSAVITNARGVIGLELFGSNGSDSQLDGILLTGETATTIYYPHVESNGWWTGIVAYNPSDVGGNMTITPYSASGTPQATASIPLLGKKNYVGIVSDLDLPAETAWFKADSTLPVTGFELFGTDDGRQLAAYAGGADAKAGVFAKIEKNGGWTGIAFVNTEAGAAVVNLTAYNDAGGVVATQALPVGGHVKVVDTAEGIFSQDISNATYIAYSSDKNVVGFQLNGSSDDTMLDGLPALGGTN